MLDSLDRYTYRPYRKNFKSKVSFLCRINIVFYLDHTLETSISNGLSLLEENEEELTKAPGPKIIPARADEKVTKRKS